MNRSRIVLLSLGLVLLVVVSAGVYLYHKLPELLRLEVERTLQRYGVEYIEYEGLRFSHTNASVDTLILRGSYENIAYQASVTSGALHYDWHALLTGNVDSLSLSSLEISVAHTAASDSQGRTIIAVGEFLPQQLFAQLPLQSLRIERWQASYRSPGNRTIDAHGSLAIDQYIDLRLQTMLANCEVAALLQAAMPSPDLRLELSMTDDQVSVATLAATLARSADNGWEWRLQGEAQHTPLLSCLREIDKQYGMNLGIPAQTELALDGESAFTARIEHPDTLNLAAAPDAADAPLRQVQASVHLTNELRRLDIPTLIEHLHGTLTLDATLADAHIKGILQPFSLAGNVATQRLSLPASWQRWIGWEETVPLRLETAEPVAITAGDNSGWSVQSPDALLSLGDKRTQLRLEQMNLEIVSSGSDPPDATVQLGTRLTTRLDKQTLPQLQVAFTLSGTLEHSEVTLHIADTAESFRADLTGAPNLTQGSGDYTLNAHIDDLTYFTATSAPLLQHFELLKDSVTIHSGTIALTTTLTSTLTSTHTSARASSAFAEENWTQRSQLVIKSVSGNINDYAFDNLNLAADWSGITRWKTLQPLKITVATFNPGIAIQDIELQLSLPQATAITEPHVRIDTLSAQLFGGELALPEAQTWDFAAASNSVTLTASNWQLGAMVALQTNADIHAEGVLEGELPITIADGRMIIDSGYLRALPPGGNIRYRANDRIQAMADSNSELALALDLLNDFQYQLLSSEVQLDKTGSLLLALSLEGSNPAQFGGQAIRFNINVEQNLDPLLQSLRIDDNLEQQIEGGLK